MCVRIHLSTTGFARLSPRVNLPCAVTLGLATLGLLFLAGCDANLSGTYEEVDGFGAMEFRRDQVYVTLPVVNTTIAADYRVDGDQVIIDATAHAPHVYILKPDGTLTGGPGMTFIKRP